MIKKNHLYLAHSDFLHHLKDLKAWEGAGGVKVVAAVTVDSVDELTHMGREVVPGRQLGGGADRSVSVTQGNIIWEDDTPKFPFFVTFKILVKFLVRFYSKTRVSSIFYFGLKCYGIETVGNVALHGTRHLTHCIYYCFKTLKADRLCLFLSLLFKS